MLSNLPFLLMAPAGWLTFYRFSSDRPPDFDSLWWVACWQGSLLTVGATVVVWRRAVTGEPDLPRWMLTFPLLAFLLVTGKVWSPQYSLWILPLFALTRVRSISFVQYQLAEVAEYMIRFLFFESLGAGSGVPYGVLAFAVVIRAILLVRYVWEWTRDPRPVIGGGVLTHARP